MPVVKNEDRRGIEDRRQRHVKAFFYQFIKPRRRSSDRRGGESEGFHVDRHERRYFFVSLAILGLCVADVYATITLLNRGSIEVNPFMRELLEFNPGLFFAFKYIATAAGIFILLSFRNFRIFRKYNTLKLLYLVMFLYSILVLYEIALLSASSA